MNSIKDDDDDDDDDDDVILSKMGYEKKLFRGLNSLSNFAFGFTEVAVLASLTSLYGYGLTTGGPVIIIWGFIIAFGCVMIVAYSMAEICSAYPSAGSVYHWTAQVVPEKYAPLCSYICGWSNFLGNAAGDASFAYSFALFLNAAIIASNYQPYSLQETVGVSILTIFIWSFLNFFRIDQVGWINTVAAICHCGAIIVIIFAILLVPPSYELNTTRNVFTLYHNETGFQNQFYVCAIGLLSATFAFSGLEASAHMAEETHGSSEAAPKGMIYTCLATGIGGLGYLLALLYSTPNIGRVLDGDTDVAAVNVFIISCGDAWGAVLCWFVVINLFFAGISSVAVTGRITFALMRDHAFPYSDFFGQVHPTLQSPIHAIMFVCIIDAFLQLLALNSSGITAFYSITGLCVIGFQISYALPIALKLIFQPVNFPKTSMSLGKWSRPFGFISTIWLVITSIILFLPTESPVTLDNMNWLIVVFSFTIICGALYWIYQGQYTFKGPPRSQGSTHHVDYDICTANNPIFISSSSSISNNSNNETTLIIESEETSSLYHSSSHNNNRNNNNNCNNNNRSNNSKNSNQQNKNNTIIRTTSDFSEVQVNFVQNELLHSYITSNDDIKQSDVNRYI